MRADCLLGVLCVWSDRAPGDGWTRATLEAQQAAHPSLRSSHVGFSGQSSCECGACAAMRVPNKTAGAALPQLVYSRAAV